MDGEASRGGRDGGRYAEVVRRTLYAPRSGQRANGGRDRGAVKCCRIGVKAGAGERTRTADLLIANRLLYQRSYAGWREKALTCVDVRSGGRAVTGSRARSEFGRKTGGPTMRARLVGSPSLSFHRSGCAAACNRRKRLQALDRYGAVGAVFSHSEAARGLGVGRPGSRRGSGRRLAVTPGRSSRRWSCTLKRPRRGGARRRPRRGRGRLLELVGIAEVRRRRCGHPRGGRVDAQQLGGIALDGRQRAEHDGPEELLRALGLLPHQDALVRYAFSSLPAGGGAQTVRPGASPTVARGPGRHRSRPQARPRLYARTVEIFDREGSARPLQTMLSLVWGSRALSQVDSSCSAATPTRSWGLRPS